MSVFRTILVRQNLYCTNTASFPKVSGCLVLAHSRGNRLRTSGYGGIRERRTDGLNLLLDTTRLLTVDALKWYVLQYNCTTLHLYHSVPLRYLYKYREALTSIDIYTTMYSGVLYSIYA